MKLLSVSLGNQRGELDIIGHVDVPNKIVMFRVLANGLLVCESESYDDMREIVFEIVALNQTNKEGMN
jgi:hypothetical protein